MTISKLALVATSVILAGSLLLRAVRPEAIKGQFDYLDDKEFPNAKNADPRDFYDNSFVDALTKSGFLKSLGIK